MATIYDPIPDLDAYLTSTEGEEEGEISENEEGGSYKTSSELGDRDELEGDTDMHDSPDEEHEFSTLGTDRFLQIVASQAKDDSKKYSGAKTKEGSEQVLAKLRKTRFYVSDTISLSKACTEAGKRRVLLAFLTGTAEDLILSRIEEDNKANRTSTFEELWTLLEQAVQGYVPGPVSITKKAFAYCIVAAGVATAKANNGVVPPLAYELQNLVKYIAQRGDKPDRITLCALYEQACSRMPKVVEKVSKVSINGVTKEQQDPARLLQELHAYHEEYHSAVLLAMGSQQVGGKRQWEGKGPGPSRKFTASKGGKQQQQQHHQGASGSTYDPFKDPSVTRSDTPTGKFSRAYVKGLSAQDIAARKEAGVCYICEGDDHVARKCEYMKFLFPKEEGCWWQKKQGGKFSHQGKNKGKKFFGKNKK